MRVILFATGLVPGLEALSERLPVPLVRLVDRPFLQHVIEQLAGQGFRTFDLVLCHRPGAIEDLVGDGQRWGVTLRTHLVRDPYHPYAALRAVGLAEADSPVLVGHADRLVPARLVPAVAGPAAPVYVTAGADAGAAARFTGWAWLDPADAARLPLDGSEADIAAALLDGAAGRTVAVPEPLHVRDYAGILAAHRAVLEGRVPDLLLTGREVEPGVWLSRNVRLPPTVRVVPPVFIGEDVSIAPGVTLGPAAVVGHDCVVDEGSALVSAVVAPGSYVGPGLDLHDVLVDRNRLINVRLGAAVTVVDAFILGSLREQQARQTASRTAARIVAGGLIATFAPLLGAAALWSGLSRRRTPFERRKVVALPAPSADPEAFRAFELLSLEPPAAAARLPEPAQHFLFRLLPGLVNVARGQLAFVGVPPRAPAEIAALPVDWRALYLESKAGLVDEAFLRYGTAASADERYTAEAFYGAQGNLRFDLQLLGLYALRLVGLARPQPTTAPEADAAAASPETVP